MRLRQIDFIWLMAAIPLDTPPEPIHVSFRSPDNAQSRPSRRRFQCGIQPNGPFHQNSGLSNDASNDFPT